MAEKYPRGDPTPIIRSINDAARILSAHRIFVDLTKEMPLASSPNYWRDLNALHAKLWNMVYAKRANTKNCKVTHVHDDGDATLECNGVEHVATTEGKLYKEVPDFERILLRLCRYGPITNFQNRRMVPEYIVNELGDFVIKNNLKPEDVDPEFIYKLVEASDRMLNTTDNYQKAREELFGLVRSTLAKSYPTLYDKFKKCLGD